MKTAIILGATGLTGGELLHKLLEDDRYSKIKLFSRSSTGVKNDKIEEHLVDLFELGKHSEDFNADEVFCCIGTTQAKTPDEETYYKIDHGIPVEAAKLAKENGIPRFMVISALGADPDSRFFYNRTKGEMERDVLAQGIPETYIFEPSLIAGNREENRPFEAAWKKVMSVGNHLLVGPLKKYRSIHAGSIADAMIYVANNKYAATRIESREIREIAESYR
ncbi:NAD(P)H-binding protein [Salinimicrobium sediminilitoris]|uniref:NAD(P)H-binding protein n=1 Tax=Salinimicrobium sediminilitoris TaxID=2876715 RepID=UPI001E5171FF|nr:NAD(P)H-binding protein [Salinimicrobium sediminilitoris]MCC8359424.1 NAD(P)H-binding protein [Salinimicrobium sediminilitoris]